MNVLGSPSPLHPSSLSTGTLHLDHQQSKPATTEKSTHFLGRCTDVKWQCFMYKEEAQRVSVCVSVIHRTQVWFHGRIMREEAHKMIIQQGQVDG